LETDDGAITKSWMRNVRDSTKPRGDSSSEFRFLLLELAGAGFYFKVVYNVSDDRTVTLFLGRFWSKGESKKKSEQVAPDIDVDTLAGLKEGV